MNILTNHLPTAELQRIDAAHHMHPFTGGDALAKKGARIITRADGMMLTDSDGREVLDMMAGLWCVNIGYGRHELAEAAYRQMKELPYYNTFFQTSHVPVIALSQKLAELAPEPFNQTFFAASGSEANDTNIRLVRQYWAAVGKPDKKIIISRKNAYHGSTMGGGSLGGMAHMHSQGGLPIENIVHIDQPHWWAEGGDMTPEEFGLLRARQLEEEIDRLGEGNVAAFIAEPIQGAGGVVIPPETYWPEIQRICDAREILLIADEVILGFGRTGRWFGSEYYGIRPDIMTIAKGLSSGYAPIGGSMVSDRVAKVIAESDFNHGYTYSGHPVSCAVALENLRIMEEESLLDHVNQIAAPALAKAIATFEDHPLIGEARSLGMLGALQFTPDKSRRAPFKAPKGTIGEIARDACFANDIVMRHVGDRMIVSPPLIMTEADTEVFVDRATRALDQTYDKAKAEGLLEAA
ncbi:aspartate aminotransferase family protein [Aestuariibius sp. 2305UL40-4]|uniref:aspartate aminotransferase family protein n=1 Tax=Aestuariibius violaceus TaxID=3234132 RepID=UPI00345E5682